MNRFKKEETKQSRAALDGLTEMEIKQLDREEDVDRKINELARSIHGERFPEEYDHMYDSAMDASDRASGKNPMNAEYIAKVAARRAAMGVSPLSESGMPTSDDSWKIAYAEAEARIRDEES